MENPLSDILAESVRRNWCVRINCTTCGATDFRRAIREMVISAGFPGVGPCDFTPAGANRLMLLLKDIELPSRERGKWDEAVRLLLYEIWRSLGGNPSLKHMQQTLGESWSATILARMIAHEAERQREGQRELERNDPLRAQERKQQKQRAHTQRMALQAIRSKLWHKEHQDSS